MKKLLDLRYFCTNIESGPSKVRKGPLSDGSGRAGEVDMGMEKLTSAARAAGFAMVPYSEAADAAGTDKPEPSLNRRPIAPAPKSVSKAADGWSWREWLAMLSGRAPA